MPPTKRKRGRALENVGTKELMAALDIEAGIISEASLRIGQQLRKLQFEEKLLREMLQRSEGADDLVAAEELAAAVDPPSTMAPAIPANTSRPAATGAANTSRPAAATSIFSEVETAQQSNPASEAAPVAGGQLPTATAAAALPSAEQIYASKPCSGPSRLRGKSAASNVQGCHREVGTRQRSALEQPASPDSVHAAVRKQDKSSENHLSSRETISKSSSAASTDADPDFDTALAGLTGLPAMD